MNGVPFYRPIALTPAKCMQIALRSIERARLTSGDTVPGRELAMMVVTWCVRGDDPSMSAEVARHAWALFLAEEVDGSPGVTRPVEDDYMLIDDLGHRTVAARVDGHPKWLGDLARDATLHLRKLGRRLPRVHPVGSEAGWELWTHSPTAVRRWLEGQPGPPAAVQVVHDPW